MKVKIKKLSNKAIMPTKAHATDAGYDLTAISREYDEFGNVVYHFGLAFEIPKGYAGLIFPRSSICKQDISLTNAVGVIDAGYRGEVTAKFKAVIRLRGDLFPREDVAIMNHDNWWANIYGIGERIAQLIILPIPNIELEEVDELGRSDRGTGGYGSTGK